MPNSTESDLGQERADALRFLIHLGFRDSTQRRLPVGWGCAVVAGVELPSV